MTLVKLFALRLVRLVWDGGWDRFYADTYFRSNFARYTRTPSTWFIVFHILCSSIDLTCVERREQNIIYIEFILYHLLINSIVVSFVCYVCSAYTCKHFVFVIFHTYFTQQIKIPIKSKLLLCRIATIKRLHVIFYECQSELLASLV